MPTLFYHKEAKKYILFVPKDELNLQCHFCKNVFESSEPIVVHRSYTKKFFVKRYYCVECSDKHRKLIADSFIMATMTMVIPDHCRLVPDNLDITSGSMSNISAVELSSLNIIDSTKHAGRESIEGATLQVTPKGILNKAYTAVEDIDTFLEDIKEAHPVLPEGKLLEKGETSHGA